MAHWPLECWLAQPLADQLKPFVDGPLTNILQPTVGLLQPTLTTPAADEVVEILQLTYSTIFQVDEDANLKDDQKTLIVSYPTKLTLYYFSKLMKPTRSHPTAHPVDFLQSSTKSVDHMGWA